MGDVKTIISNFMFQIEDTVDMLRKTLLKCLATFLIWFVTVFAIGLGILITLKIAEIWFL